MKNAAFLVCAPLAFVWAVPALSQSTSSVTQGGDSNIANVTQQNANSTTIEQVGERNLATSQQIGNGNEASILQQNVRENDAGIYQASINSTATISQTAGADLSNATINQLSGVVSSTARIEQSGAVVDGPIAIIDQFGGTGNSATIIQGDTTPFGGAVTSAPNSYADKLQIGDENESLIVQGGLLQWARNNGIGSRNSSQITQGALGGGEGVVFVLQLSDENISNVVQNSSGNEAEVVQEIGSGNESMIDQGYVDGAGSGGDNNGGFVLQQGSGNVSLIEQNLLAPGGSNSATVNQFGDNNWSAIRQEGTGNTATVTQGVGTGPLCGPVGGSCGL